MNISHWKTTANGILSLITTVCLALGSMQVPTALQTPQVSHIWLWVTFGSALTSAICRAIIGMLQSDAQPANVVAQQIVAAGGLEKSADTAPPATIPIAKVVGIGGGILGILALFFMLGCSPIEQNARDTAAALGGVLTAAQTQNQSCITTPTQPNCVLITKGIDAQNLLITASETYCGWNPLNPPTNPNEPCVPVKGALPALQAAVSNAVLLTTEIKGIIK